MLVYFIYLCVCVFVCFHKFVIRGEEWEWNKYDNKDKEEKQGCAGIDLLC